MNAADRAIANSLQFEVKKGGLKQLQSGEWTLSLKVHPNEVPAPLLTAAMGTRYMAVLVELNDDETPVEQPQPDKKEDKHKLSRQAAMLCGDTQFHRFLQDEHFKAWADCYGANCVGTADAQECVRHICQVQSRSEFDSNPEAAARWHDLKASFEAWRLA